MISELTLEQFLINNRINEETFHSAQIEWNQLKNIGIDHLKNTVQLSETASFFAKVIQGFNSVHSVRWRIKDPEHLLEKIIRKRAQKSEKYSDISCENYSEKITDLIGIRALHLFKDDCFEIDAQLMSLWAPSETPIAYIREGDGGKIIEQYKEKGFEVEVHSKGYRSIHYIVNSSPTKKNILAEIQIRTIFEEGWSEIDHKVRYPNFSDNESVSHFLSIFNRIAGSADEMGNFVKELCKSIQEYSDEICIAKNERDDYIEQLNNKIDELKKAQSSEATDKVSDFVASAAEFTKMLNNIPCKRAESSIYSKLISNLLLVQDLNELDKMTSIKNLYVPKKKKK